MLDQKMPRRTLLKGALASLAAIPVVAAVTRADAAPAADDQCARCVGHQAAPSTRQTFCPPNPKELEIACWTFAGRATFGTQSTGTVGSGVS